MSDGQKKIGIVVLGATGSIGDSTLDVIRRHSDKYEVIALTANTQVEKLFQQCLHFNPKTVAMRDVHSASLLRKKLAEAGLTMDVLEGEQGLIDVAKHTDADYVMAAIVGAAGLKATLAAVEASKRILLANKESLVMTGELFMNAVRQSGSELLPIDSEHNAIFQSMPADYVCGAHQAGVKKILLTASGGPFRNNTLAELKDVTPEQACAHPNWSMGQKISVDSATLMNKGLELIEACWLFNVKPEKIQVVVHRESIIHSMVEYLDGSVIAQMGNPDMRIPIAYGLAWPHKIDSGVSSLDLFDIAQLNFEKPDLERFPSLRITADAMNAGGTSTAIMNAANEVAVESFLAGQMAFTRITDVVEETLKQLPCQKADCLESVFESDSEARLVARDYIKSLPQRNNP